ncbi:hypothetical protein E4T56_gene10123 [Termitomyces sp. T112]|nr:hypothetical protein E4T56_gene10123 [Termitomyces sp. T112]
MSTAAPVAVAAATPAAVANASAHATTDCPLPSNPPCLPSSPSKSITISWSPLQGLLQTFGAGIAQHIPHAHMLVAAGSLLPP